MHEFHIEDAVKMELAERVVPMSRLEHDADELRVMMEEEVVADWVHGSEEEGWREHLLMWIWSFRDTHRRSYN
jgi:hypothetical protein